MKFVLFLVVWVLLGAPGSARAETSVAVVDLQGAVAQTEEGMRAQAELKKLMDRRQSSLDARQTELSKTRDDIQIQARFFGRQALLRRTASFQKELINVQTAYVDFNKELDKKYAEVTAPILKRMHAIIAKLARQGSFDLVIDKRAVPYSRVDLDLTDKLIQLYNAGDAG